MVKFVIGLTTDGTSDTARDRITDFLSRYGVEPTTSGLVTLSFTASAEAFDEVFQSATQDQPLPRTADAVGASGPETEPPISIPDEIAPFVDYVSVAPTARHFRGSV
ncbi:MULTISPECIES: hypothetical protein [unclassified Marinovum]